MRLAPFALRALMTAGALSATGALLNKALADLVLSRIPKGQVPDRNRRRRRNSWNYSLGNLRLWDNQKPGPADIEALARAQAKRERKAARRLELRAAGGFGSCAA